MSECHKCRTATEIEEGTWKDVPFDQTPCASCQLSSDSFGTLPYIEACAANSSQDQNPDDEDWKDELADAQSPMPFASIDRENQDDPSVPLSALVDAMQLWMRLSLPARKTFQLRMVNVPYSEIGKRLGFSRQMAEKLVAKAIAEDGRLQNLLPAKKGRSEPSLSTTRNLAMADKGRVSGQSSEKRQKMQILIHNAPHTRTA